MEDIRIDGVEYLANELRIVLLAQEQTEHRLKQF
jgi:hypothetical protein